MQAIDSLLTFVRMYLMPWPPILVALGVVGYVTYRYTSLSKQRDLRKKEAIPHTGELPFADE